MPAGFEMMRRSRVPRDRRGRTGEREPVRWRRTMSPAGKPTRSVRIKATRSRQLKHGSLNASGNLGRRGPLVEGRGVVLKYATQHLIRVSASIHSLQCQGQTIYASTNRLATQHEFGLVVQLSGILPESWGVRE